MINKIIVTKSPDQIGTVVKPTQSYASLNFELFGALLAKYSWI